jgi:3-oxoacyl-[acyl-carrier-protein] synthase III
VDLVILATTTADELQPNAAPLVAHGIGTRDAGAFDIGAGCTGLLSAVGAAATVPLALTVALEDGRLGEGANVLLCAFGSGFTWSAGVVRWGTAHA